MKQCKTPAGKAGGWVGWWWSSAAPTTTRQQLRQTMGVWAWVGMSGDGAHTTAEGVVPYKTPAKLKAGDPGN
jgi:hypothetical protein